MLTLHEDLDRLSESLEVNAWPRVHAGLVPGLGWLLLLLWRLLDAERDRAQTQPSPLPT